ncbi:MAG: hypothetical protein IKU24_00175 [Clostridia bacterium]|nr:hypothetical protein [Clostridia bacterium]
MVNFSKESLSTSATSEDVNVLLLKRFAKKLDEQIRAAFPNTEFSFEVHTDENKTPILIKVVSDHKDVAQKISNWIQENYNIEAKAK